VTGLSSDQKPKQVTLADLLEFVKNFKGITRKSALGELLPIQGENLYDDAVVLFAWNIFRTGFNQDASFFHMGGESR